MPRARRSVAHPSRGLGLPATPSRYATDPRTAPDPGAWGVGGQSQAEGSTKDGTQSTRGATTSRRDGSCPSLYVSTSNRDFRCS